MFDLFLFVGLPYIALSLCVIGTIVRMKWFGFTVTSHSSQFLETNWLFWGSRFFHYGIITVIAGHLLSLFFPDFVVTLTGSPKGLTIVQTIAFSFGLTALIGIVILILRRLIHDKLQSVTSTVDTIVYSLLALQVITGLLVAFYNRWGTVWYTTSMVPYLRSLLTFMPDTSVISTMPFLLKTHVVLAYLFVALIPFSRLIHFFTYPLNYFFRSNIVVIWNRDLKTMRKSTNMREGKKTLNN